MTNLDFARREIEKIDAEMATLFERRMELCRDVSDFKISHGLPVKDSAREAALIERNRSLISDASIEPYYTKLLKTVIDLSCQYQADLRSDAQ